MSEKKSSNWIVYILALMFMGPLVAAWVWFFYFQDIRTDKTSNLGELVTPARQFSSNGLRVFGDEQFSNISFAEDWTILLLSRGECDLDCENMLYQSRQVWIRLGKESNRVQRIFVTDANQIGEEISAQNLDAVILQAQDQFFEQFNEKSGLAIFVIDPRGFLVLRYKMPLDPAALYKDLRRVLKYSKIG